MHTTMPCLCGSAKHPTFGNIGENPTRCKKCKLNYHVSIHELCVHTSCFKTASYGLQGKGKRITHCSEHAKGVPDLVNRRNGLCKCYNMRTYKDPGAKRAQYCFYCKREDSIVACKTINVLPLSPSVPQPAPRPSVPRPAQRPSMPQPAPRPSVPQPAPRPSVPQYAPKPIVPQHAPRSSVPQCPPKPINKKPVHTVNRPLVREPANPLEKEVSQLKCENEILRHRLRRQGNLMLGIKFKMLRHF